MLTNSHTQDTNIFACEKCDFSCSKNSYWKRHIVTAKHIRLTNVNIFLTNEAEEKKSYDCAVCNKTYKSRVGLWKHNKICIEKTVNEPVTTTLPDVLKEPVIV